METKRVRPVLVEIKFNSIEEMQGDIILRGNKLYTCEQLNALQLQKKENSDKVFELILISLEDENFKEGDVYFCKYGNTIDFITKDNYISESHIRAKTFNKVIARQSQINPEYISKFIEQYNNGNVLDFRIEKEFVIKLMKSLGVEGPVNYLKLFQERQDPLTKTLLRETDKEKIWIEGFDREDQLFAFILKANFDTCIYAGKVSDISEELAKDLADKGSLCEFYWNEEVGDYDKNTTASESVQSHCKQKYCVIYKLK